LESSARARIHVPDTYSNLRGRINTLIKSAENLTGEIQAAIVEKAYELLRNVCEVIVEQELLQGVTQRYHPNVMMTRLTQHKFRTSGGGSGRDYAAV